MLDIKRIRSNPDELKDALRKRNKTDIDVDALLALDESRRTLLMEIEAMKADGRFDAYTKKEQAGLNKEHTKLELALGGIRNMHDLPDALFIVDTKHEDNAVREAHRLHIPIVGLIDTNADPDDIDYGIPANDDAIRSVNLLCQLAADALVAGSGTVVTEQEMTADADKEVPAIPEEPEISERVEVSESTIKEIEEKTEEVAE